jgi:hypothetical protein
MGKMGVGQVIEPGTVTIEGKLVRHLREGAKNELLANTWDLQEQLLSTVDPQTFRGIVACLKDSLSLFEFVGFVDADEPRDLIVDLSLWPRLVLRVLESRHDAEVRRLQDAAGSNFTLPLGDVPALGILVLEIQQKTGAPPRLSHSRRDIVDRSR